MQNHSFRPVVLLPVTNATSEITSLIQAIRKFKLPVLIIDHSSNPGLAHQLDELTEQAKDLTLIRQIRHPHAGSVLVTAILTARNSGFTHLLTMGENHCLCISAIDSLLPAAQALPESFICGFAQHSDKPLLTSQGRFQTAMFYSESASRSLIDASCLCRVYPVAAVAEIIEKHRLTSSHGIYLEIPVHLSWKDTPIVNVALSAQNSICSPLFRGFIDNMRVMIMHWRMLGRMKKNKEALGQRKNCTLQILSKNTPDGQ